jgi:hypothetical protein
MHNVDNRNEYKNQYKNEYQNEYKSEYQNDDVMHRSCRRQTIYKTLIIQEWL